MADAVFRALEEIGRRPALFEPCDAADLWTDEHVSGRMLAGHLEYETEARFDLVTLIMCDSCALGPAQRNALLRRIRSLLRPGGALLFDAYSLEAYDQREEETRCEAGLMDGFWSAAPYYGFQCTFKYDEARVVLDMYTIVEAARTRVVLNWLQYFSPEALVRELEAAGLAVHEWLGDVAGTHYEPTAGEFAVIAG